MRSLLGLLLLVTIPGSSGWADSPGVPPGAPSLLRPPAADSSGAAALFASAEPAVPAWSPEDDAELGMADPRLTPRPLRALSEVVAVNVAIWSYNRYIRENGENPGFRIGFNSWQENFNNGFEWDDNGFTTNQFAHPYHGSMYFNAARANNYDFWTSVPFTFLGSFLWEYCFEVHHPAYNDWIATSVGGSTLGEMLFRVSDLLVDDTARGSNRAWREVGVLALDPVRGFNRIVTGEASHMGDNANRMRPGYLGFRLDSGIRVTGERKLSDADTTRMFLDLNGRYGDPFQGDRKKPFDSFDLAVGLNFGDAAVVAGVHTHGLLAAPDLGHTENNTYLWAFHLNFDYINTNAYVLGGQSVTGGIMSRFEKTAIGDIQAQVNLGVIPLGGVKSDYGSYTGRDYDFGPGALGSISATLLRGGRSWFEVGHTETWINTLNGNDGYHLVGLTRVRVDIPIVQRMGVGAAYRLYTSHNHYDHLEDTDHKFPELRAFLTFPLH